MAAATLEERPAPRLPWERVATGRIDECWEWAGARKESGYGVLAIDGRQARAHRVSYEDAFGPIPAGLLVCHHCDNPPCVNPAHLFLGTYADNNRDMAEKGRARGGSRVSGERHHRARLTDTAVETIRAAVAAGESQAAVARRFGVSTSQVNNIVHGRQRVSS